MFSQKLVPLRSLRSSLIVLFSFGNKRCNTSQGFGAFFVQSCDLSCSPVISFVIFFFLNFIAIIVVEFLLKLTISPQKIVFFYAVRVYNKLITVIRDKHS